MPPFEAWSVHHSRTLTHSLTRSLAFFASLSLSVSLSLSLCLRRVQVAANSSNFLDRTFSVQCTCMQNMYVNYVCVCGISLKDIYCVHGVDLFQPLKTAGHPAGMKEQPPGETTRSATCLRVAQSWIGGFVSAARAERPSLQPAM